jgi:hypothetical protein
MNVIVHSVVWSAGDLVSRIVIRSQAHALAVAAALDADGQTVEIRPLVEADADVAKPTVRGAWEVRGWRSDGVGRARDELRRIIAATKGPDA